MICLNAFARQRASELEREAHVSTEGIRVRIIHPRYTRVCPHFRAGVIRLPAAMFTYEGWPRTWRHELQHAVDDRSGLLSYLTSDEAEQRARQAEHRSPRG
jgi:hypothetical protein